MIGHIYYSPLKENIIIIDGYMLRDDMMGFDGMVKFLLTNEYYKIGEI